MTQANRRTTRSPRRGIPAPWEPLFKKASGINTTTDLARAIGIGVTTVTDAIHAEPTRVTTDATLQAIADGLGVSFRKVQAARAAVIEARTGRLPFTLPPEADVLSEDQRETVVALVLSFAETERARLEATGELGESAGDDAESGSRKSKFGDAADRFKGATEKRRDGESAAGSG